MADSNDFQNAVNYALSLDGDNSVKDYKGNINNHKLVDKVRKYFNENNISYGNFSFDDVKPYI